MRLNLRVTTMKAIQNERGMALVTALLLTLISLAIILALLYVITQGIQTSAANKRYQNALEASYGGTEVFTKEVIPQVMTGTSLAAVAAALPLDPGNAGCFSTKLNFATALWGAACSNDARTSDPKTAPDVTIRLRGPRGQANFYNVYAKVIDTLPGNSDASGIENLDSAAGVAYGNAGVSPKHMPATYHIEVQGEQTNNPQEKARLSVLYAY